MSLILVLHSRRCDTEMDAHLSESHVLITGASGGIGSKTAELFLQENARVTAAYHTTPRKLEELNHQYPDRLLIVQVDVREEEQVKDLFHQATAKFGRVDILIANAGIANEEGVAIHEMPLSQWETTVSVNLTGAFLCAKHFFRNLDDHPEDTAALVMIGSTAGIFGEAWYCDYAASKAAMHGLMMSLKNEIVHLAPRGRVNTVNPGWTMTPMAERALQDEEMLKTILQTIPQRKTAVTDDIANAIVFLSSDHLAGHISGQSITVAGGMEGRVLFSRDELET
ncbi:SDR family oxidoreductase [Candidatus Thorarchaeota archaeon]|nr:MAG: SDR family oxidoreductase [Candidatus Thorarchaeota archaeon]